MPRRMDGSCEIKYVLVEADEYATIIIPLIDAHNLSSL